MFKKWKMKQYNINGYKLDKTQTKVVLSKRKKILVLAGAGSGKSLTIIARVKHLIHDLNVNPRKILCISFTNDAVENLKKDLNEKDVDIMTFHKLALKIIGKKREVLTEDMLMDIIIDSFSNDTLFGLYQMTKKEMYSLVNVFINLFKSNNYSLDMFYKFISRARNKEKILLKEIMKCYICYESYLKKEGLLDFNDMINDGIKSLDYSSIRYKHIIIDEYQDTSLTKFLLIKKMLRLSNASFFAVGDDFQSIYRFTGSNIKIITNFKRYFPLGKVFKLKNTYRTPDELIKIAGKFIMKNHVQIRKKLSSTNKELNSVEIIYYENLNSKINDVIATDKINNLFILSRNNMDLEKINVININFRKLTIHKSKGLQEDYVFIIGLHNNKNGFPNKNKDHEILRYVNNYKEYYPYEEERRLFYVALTRCKKKVYLFVPKDNPSIFIKELIKYKKVKIREK